MRISTSVYTATAIGDETEEQDFTIDPENLSLAIAQFYTYAEPIPSVVRETVSNALDAHLEAKAYSTSSWEKIVDDGWTKWLIKKTQYVDEDGNIQDFDTNAMAHVKYALEMERMFKEWKNSRVQVKLISGEIGTDSGAKFIIKDDGVGISPERLKKVYAKFFSSTKRGTNKQIGAFGLGAKSPLGYTDFFRLSSRWNGIEYVWAIYKGEKAPIIRKLSEEPTDEPNGTTVEIDIKDRVDAIKFEDAVTTQLAYFENIEYHGFNIKPGRIVKGKHFIYRENTPFFRVHLCLGTVYYPIDMIAMGWDSAKFNCPIALHFSMDEVTKDEEEGKISILWNREGIQYNRSTIGAIASKLELVKAELQELYNSKVDRITTMEQYIKMVGIDDVRQLEVAEGVNLMYVQHLVKPKLRYPKYDGIRLPKDPFFLWTFFKKIRGGKPIHNLHTSETSPKSLIIRALRGDKNIYFLNEGGVSSVKNQFLEWSGVSEFYIMKRYDPSDTYLMGGFNIKPDDDEGLELARDFVEEFQTYIESLLLSYADVEPTEEFRIWKRQTRTKKYKYIGKGLVRGTNQLPIRFLKDDGKGYTYKKYSWTMGYIDEVDAYVSTALTIYGHQEDDELLKKIAALLNRSTTFSQHGQSLRENRCRVIKIAQSTAKYFEENPNAMHVGVFIESRHPVIMRHVTAYLIYQQVYPDLTHLLNIHIKEVAPSLYSSAKILDTYCRQYYLENSNAPTMNEELLEQFKTLEKDRLKELKKWETTCTLLKRKGFKPLPPRPKTRPLIDSDIVEHIRKVKHALLAFPLLRSIEFHKATPMDVHTYIYMRGKYHTDLVGRLVNKHVKSRSV